MSYILDALKRSEQERQRSEVPMQTAVALEPPPASRRAWPLWVAAGVVAANLLVLGMLLWQRQPARAPSPAPSAAAAPSRPQEPASLAALSGSDRALPMLAAPPREPVQQPVRERAKAPGTPPAVVAAVPPAPAAHVPELAELPEDVRRGIPPVPVNIHVYAEQPAGRFVLVDMKRYGEGSALPSGVRIERITPRGLILTHQGQRFQLTVR